MTDPEFKAASGLQSPLLVFPPFAIKAFSAPSADRLNVLCG